MKSDRIDFYREAQRIIEEEYLNSYPEYDQESHSYQQFDKFGNRKDGYIERQIHGGMHVGRASLWVIALHKMIKDHFPGYVSLALTSMKQSFELEESDVIDLTRLAVICHDSARCNEGRDYWDKQSAEKFKKQMARHPYSEKVLEIFAVASANKDKENAFSLWLATNHQDQACHYIRQLIKLADCIDIIRCCGSYQFDVILNEFAQVKTTSALRENFTKVMMEFAKNVHRAIYLQGDMLFNCRIKMPDGKVMQTDYQGDHFVLKQKVKFEHADNVVSALAADIMQQTPYFSSFLSDEPLLSTELAIVKPQLDAFIHGTQSSMLPMMEKSGFVMDSPLGLLRKQCTSVTGELFRSCGATEINISPLPCFGKLHTWSGYGFSEVVDRYAKFDGTNLTPEDHQKNAVEMFHKSLQAARKDSYNSIKALQIYYLRAKYFGADDTQLMDPTLLYNEYKAARDVYYLLMLMAVYLEVPNDHPCRFDLNEMTRSLYQFNHVRERIQKSGLDLEEIYDHPTSENLQKLLPLFPTLESTDENPSSCVRILPVPRDCANFQSDDNFDRVTYMGSFPVKMYTFIYSGVVTSCFYPAKQHIELMNEHLDILKASTLHQPANIFDHPQHREFLCRNFPVVLVCDDAEAVTLAGSQREYRAKRPLQLGVDINMVATDTRENAALLKKWLDQHGFHRVAVLLLSELARVRNSAAHPNPVYQHSGGFPRLSWLAAQKVTPEQAIELESSKNAAETQAVTCRNAYRQARSEGVNSGTRNELARIFSAADRVSKRVAASFQMVEDAALYKKPN